MIFQQLMALSKLKPRKLINLVLSIAALISAIILLGTIFSGNEPDDVLYNNMTSLLSQISFCAMAVECALIFYAVLYIVEELFIRLYHKIIDKSHFIKKELLTENDTEKITGKQFIARISILLGIFVLINIFFLYCLSSDQTIITATSITEKSFFNPSGTTYDYNDITSVEIDQSNGNPTYIMKMNDGNTVKAIEGSVEEIYQINKIVNKYDVPKNIRCLESEINRFEDTDEKQIAELFK